MKKRLLKKINKRKLNAIMDNIELQCNCNIEKRYFGNGYFIFEFGNNIVAHFHIKELPLWKFGIWLNLNNKYQLFGEPIPLIDKFKPSRTVFSYESNNIDKALLDIILMIQDGYGTYIDIKESVEYDIEYDNTKDLIDRKIYDYIFKKIQEVNEKNIDKFQLKLEDGNTKDYSISPRYSISLHTNTEMTQKDWIEDLKKSILEISENIPFVEDDDSPSLLESYIFEYLNSKLISKGSFEYRKKAYNWNKSENYEDYIIGNTPKDVLKDKS